MLQDGKPGLSNAGITTDQFARLRERSEPLDICAFEPAFADFLALPIKWQSAFDFLATVYIAGARELQETSTRHLILFNLDNLNFLVHLCLNEAGEVRGTVVSREKRDADGAATRLEAD